jgi:capsule polysaccharide export protein KpsE/RkpR
VRAQLIALKTLSDTQAAQIAALQAQVASLQAQLTAGIAGTANNIPGVAPLGLTISDPPQQSEVQPLADKMDELINTLLRV